MKVSVSHVFRPVGQGLFAQGRVRPHCDLLPSLHWVHDCGSVNNPDELAREIDRARHMMGEPKRLDVLILSHFDADHVNGLRPLLAGVHVGTIVLPYATPAERLLFAIQARDPVSNDYVDFLAQPARYLESIAGSIEEIVYVDSDENDEQNQVAGEGDQPPTLAKSPEVRAPRSRLMAIANIEARVRSRGVGVHERRLQGDVQISDGQFWEFLFFNRRRWRGCNAALRGQVDNTLYAFFGQPVELRDYACLVRILRDLYRDRSQFGGSAAGRNEISLLTYAGPVGTPHIGLNGASQCDASGPHRFRGLLPKDSRQSLLYTGDITMRLSLRKMLQRKLGVIRWSRIGPVQMPHHGAGSAWLDPHPGVWRHRWSVFCYGIGNSHEHPHASARAVFHISGHRHVTQNQGFNWWYVAEWRTRRTVMRVEDE